MAWGSKRLWRRAIFALATALCVIVSAAWFWVIPTVIRTEVELATGGKATFTSWWINTTTSGLSGLVIHEGHSATSPIRFKADQVTTDVSLAKFLSQGLNPQLVRVTGPELSLRFDARGKPMALPESQKPSSRPLPKVEVDEGILTIRQEGKPDLVIDRFAGSITPNALGRMAISATAQSDTWGKWNAAGVLAKTFTEGEVTLTQLGSILVKPHMLSLLPFVPATISDQIQADGQVAAQLRFLLPGKNGEVADVRVGIRLGPDGDVNIPPLDLKASHAIAEVTIEAGIVDLNHFEGQALGGKIAGSGRLDFAIAPPRFAIKLDLAEIDVARAPARWQLKDLQATGRLTGIADLRIIDAPGGIDLTGSSGSAEITGGTLQGIPVKSLKLTMQADKGKIEYVPGATTSKPASSDAIAPPMMGAGAGAGAILRVAPLLLTALQDPPPVEPPKPLMGLKMVSTQIELEDVDLADVIAKVEKLSGIKVPIPIRGRLSIKADAAIPLGAIGQLRDYTFHGQAKLTSASIAGLDLGRLEAKLALEAGVLELRDFRGILVERSEVPGEGPTTPLAAVPATGPLPERSFRGVLRMELAPRGQLTARFEGVDLPIHELTTPFAVGLSPFHGSASVQCDARSHVETLGDLGAWRVNGAIQSRRFAVGEHSTSSLQARFALKDRRLVIHDIKGDLRQQPLGGQIKAELVFPEDLAKPIDVLILLKHVDTSTLATLVPQGQLQLSGVADGEATATISRTRSDWQGRLVLKAQELTIQGQDAEAVQIHLGHHDKILDYEVTGETLGGKVKIGGRIPFDPRSLPLRQEPIDAEVRAVGMTLAQVWPLLKVQGAATRIGGETALVANVRYSPNGNFGLSGVGEVRQLGYGPGYPWGSLKGEVRMTQSGWRIEPLEGELFGGVTEGKIWSESVQLGVERLDFDLRVDRASLSKMLAFLPIVASHTSGFATVRAEGRMSPALRATANIFVAQAKFAGLPLTEIRAPLELTLSPNRASGLLHIRSASARAAGGKLQGDAQFRLGEDQTYSATLRLSDLDLEPIARLSGDARRPVSGRVSGKLTVGGTHPGDTNTLRGQIHLTLADASVVDVPIFREIDKFLGSARGGVFESGTLDGAISRRVLTLEAVTLNGRLAQIHATGTIGMGGQLNLEVLVSTRDVIPQTGQALLAAIPGLRDVLGRQADEVSKVSSYLSSRLLKLRVTGTLRSPSVNLNPGAAVGEAAVGFFGSVLQLPLGLLPGRSSRD